MLLAVTVLSASEAPEVRVVLHAKHSSCKERVAVTRENQSPAIAWRDESTAVVTVVKMDMAGLVIAERAPRGQLSDGSLNLCYNLEPPLPSNGDETSTCASPVSLEFIVSGIPHSRYRLYVAPCSPAG